MYDVSRAPEMRREMLQLQRWAGRGREEEGTRKVWVAAPQEQDTVRLRGDMGGGGVEVGEGWVGVLWGRELGVTPLLLGVRKLRYEGCDFLSW
tara:strand:+ start:13004 stop:13282 length:279 start_codon:yes stop_codon:yes gene_type:complete